MSSPKEKYVPIGGDPAFPPRGSHFYQYPIQPVSKCPAGLAAATEKPDVQHLHESSSNSSDLNEGEEKGKKLELLGSGPGGVPQKYFNVSTGHRLNTQRPSSSKSIFFLQLKFENLFEEDNDTKIFRVLFKYLGLVYKFFKLVLYHVFVIFLGIPLAVMWGVVNGIVIFVLVWIWAPLLRLTIVSIHAVTPAVTVPIQALLAPLVDAIGRVFRQIRIRGDLSESLGLKGIRSVGEEHIA